MNSIIGSVNPKIRAYKLLPVAMNSFEIAFTLKYTSIADKLEQEWEEGLNLKKLYEIVNGITR